MIKCKSCGDIKPEDMFHWSNRALGVRKPDCKRCRSQAKPKEWTSGGRTCNVCKHFKKLSEFGVRRTGSPNAVCKLCIKIQRSRTLHPEIDPTQTRLCDCCGESKFVIDFPRNKNSRAGLLNVCKPCYVEKNIHRIYSISKDRLEEMFVLQDGKCAICKNDFGISKSNMRTVDHDHSCCSGQTSCGKCVRGLLCGACNLGLGSFRDNINSLRAAITYLS